MSANYPVVNGMLTPEVVEALKRRLVTFANVEVDVTATPEVG